MITADLNVFKTFFKGSYRKLHHMLMLCCEVLKEPAEIVVTTLPHHLHFYCIYSLKARIIIKEKLL